MLNNFPWPSTLNNFLRQQKDLEIQHSLIQKHFKLIVINAVEQFSV